MKIEDILKQRSNGVCELSGEAVELYQYAVPFAKENNADGIILISKKCLDQIEKKEELDAKFWERILLSAMWSEVPAVQVVAWRMLNRFRSESWASEALEMMYLDQDMLQWAEATNDHILEASELHKDCNGNVLVNGDTVTLIKDLDVKGSTLNAKIGTAVRNIKLVRDNHEQIEGKIEGQSIVILTKYVKKQ